MNHELYVFRDLPESAGRICSTDALTTVHAEYDDSVAYVDRDYEEHSSQPVFLTLPYVCGRVLLASVLDSLVTMVRYASGTDLSILQVSVVGFTSDQQRILDDVSRRKCKLHCCRPNF